MIPRAGAGECTKGRFDAKKDRTCGRKRPNKKLEDGPRLHWGFKFIGASLQRPDNKNVATTSAATCRAKFLEYLTHRCVKTSAFKCDKIHENAFQLTSACSSFIEFYQADISRRHDESFPCY
jgi:hypothetical protein